MSSDDRLMRPGAKLRNRRPPAEVAAEAAAARNLIGFAGCLHLARQRLSRVGDVMRQIPRTIGWSSTSASLELIASQGMSMGALYICDRLERSGVYRPELEQELLRIANLLQDKEVHRSVYPTLAYVGSELERMHPATHERVARQMGVGRFTSEQHVVDSLVLWASFKYQGGRCNWSDVVSLFAVAGGVAVDCVHQGNPEFLYGVVSGVRRVIEKEIGIWIHQNGGWIGLDRRFKAKSKKNKWLSWKLAILIVMIAIFFFAILGVATEAPATKVTKRVTYEEYI